MEAGRGAIALSEVIGAMSYALDMTEGEPPGHAVRSCLIGMRIADQIGLAAEARHDLFYALLLKDAGCSANSARMAALFGADDHQLKRTGKRVDWSRGLPALVWSLPVVAPGGSVRARAQRLRAIHDEGKVTQALMQARCDRGAAIARMLGFSDRTAEAVRALDEHWDGRGQPRGLRGTEIPLAARIMCLSQTAEMFHAAGGPDAACRVAAVRSGTWFDPALAAALLDSRADADFWRSLSAPDVSAYEPPDRLLVADEPRLDRIADAFAAIVDAKSPWTYQHSDRTCLIAGSIAAVLGFPPTEVRDLERAARLHDIGKLAISNRILDKPSALTDAEFAKVKQHPLDTHRILERVPGYAQLAPLASAHHERLDGGGYPYGWPADALTMPMRVLAVADVYEALTSQRPYRAAWSSRQALDLMRRDVPRRLDGVAFAALETLVEDAPAKSDLHVADAARAELVLTRPDDGPPGARRDE